MELDNDTRGWIMTALSGIACIIGASIICVDILIRLIPSQRNFRIQDSNAFLSCSFSLTFGLMLFLSLFSVLGSAKSSLQKGGFSLKGAAWTLIACFLAGVIGIQWVSNILHRFMPTHVVDCDHTHDEEAPADDHDHDKAGPARDHSHGSHDHYHDSAVSFEASSQGEMFERPHREAVRRPSFPAQLTHKVSQIMSSSKAKCDEVGPCYGYSDPCGIDCFKIVHARGGIRIPPGALSKAPGLVRSATTSTPHHTIVGERQPLLQHVDADLSASSQSLLSDTGYNTLSRPDPATHVNGNGNRSTKPHSTHSSISHHYDEHEHDHHDHGPNHHHHGPPDPNHHHHHVPTNAFLSVGLQTSIAIALHKLPEGFITYATNHANPQLGLSVFLALFIHNIVEGFAMALPLYLAVNSRWKAMFWSSLLGGVSQPLGAGIAALWFKAAGRSGFAQPSEAVYGGMFAVTAGIMASVALQLFTEAMDLTHNRRMCMIFAFIGMGILGASSALTA
ncbi:uncharacterized protein K452DRAFT_316899 [Aplosporella prunicola CBS 121167]|uniref:Zinc/iron permease n=1 Tax=Aplosporella prunicola CBS 121167 TaxID=1176127 RepID=A0A6A6BLL0_9PEZI|nr:uncharacterized protein K452DRAFT_316899 [Aplosporella prunicola CBS 121167]KAF2144164.1 hypothetical protein K452DRAFT_316899 [Aplosporella prunicola CBS 121167]